MPARSISRTASAAHRWIAAQPVGIVHILVVGQPPKHRLPQRAGQPVAAVFAGARIREHVTTCIGQVQRVMQLAIG